MTPRTRAVFEADPSRYDFRRVGPLTLSFQRSVVFNGEPAEPMSEALASLEIDAAIDPAVFRRQGS